MTKIPYLDYNKNFPQYNSYIGRMYENNNNLITAVKNITF